MRSVPMILALLMLAAPAVASAQYGYPPAGNQTVTCESQGSASQQCRLPDNWRGARIVQQLSHSACIQGRSWGFIEAAQSVWVSNGCRARFAAAGYWQSGPQPGYPGSNQTVSCGSPQHRPARCPVPGHWRGARIVQQTSKAACVRGRTWGFERGGIWVDKGCGGVFAPGHYDGGWQPGPGWNQSFVVSCGSPQYRYYFCQVDVGARGRVMLQRQNSSSACIEGRTWGWNRAGIWVDKGCGAQFMVVRRW